MTIQASQSLQTGVVAFLGILLSWPVFAAQSKETGPRTHIKGETRLQLAQATTLTRNEILRLQQLLAELGFRTGRADGIMGRQTEDAIRSYQQAMKLPVDGRATENILQSVRSTKRIVNLIDGDCIVDDAPASERASGRALFGERTVPCTDPHNLEVYHVLRHPAVRSAQFPGDDSLYDRGFSQCAGAFEEYIGAPYLHSGYVMSPVWPTVDEWKRGTRTIVCVLERSDGGRWVGQARGLGPILGLGSIMMLQIKLREAGYGYWPISGELNWQTRKALKHFQSDRGLTVTGQPTRQLLKEQFDIIDFRELRLVSAAKRLPAGIGLAEADGVVSGAAWWPEKQNALEGFTTDFIFRFKDPARPAEGFAFVVQNVGEDAIGWKTKEPNGLGWKGMGNSIAVEFDTEYTWFEHDPNDNHIALRTGDTHDPKSWSTTQKAVAVPQEDMWDGQPHHARIIYEPGWVWVYLDDLTAPVLGTPISLPSEISTWTGSTFVGFTAGRDVKQRANAGQVEILSWSFSDIRQSQPDNDGRDRRRIGLSFERGDQTPIELVPGEVIELASLIASRNTFSHPVPEFWLYNEGFTPKPHAKGGWGAMERWGVWMVGEEAMFRIRLPRGLGETCRFYLEGRYFLAPQHPGFRARIQVGEEIPVEISATYPDRGFTAKIPFELPRDHTDITVKLTVDQPRSPQSLGRGQDSRRLSVGLSKIGIEGCH